MLKLYIGNKNYSSWSMRPWVLLKQAGIPFIQSGHISQIDDLDFDAIGYLKPEIHENLMKLRLLSALMDRRLISPVVVAMILTEPSGLMERMCQKT